MANIIHILCCFRSHTQNVWTAKQFIWLVSWSLADKIKKMGVHEFSLPPSNGPDTKGDTFLLYVIFSARITYYFSLLSYVQFPLIGRRWRVWRSFMWRGVDAMLGPNQMSNISIGATEARFCTCFRCDVTSHHWLDPPTAFSLDLAHYV